MIRSHCFRQQSHLMIWFVTIELKASSMYRTFPEELMAEDTYHLSFSSNQGVRYKIDS